MSLAGIWMYGAWSRAGGSVGFRGMWNMKLFAAPSTRRQARITKESKEIWNIGAPQCVILCLGNCFKKDSSFIERKVLTLTVKVCKDALWHLCTVKTMIWQICSNWLKKVPLTLAQSARLISGARCNRYIWAMSKWRVCEFERCFP